VTDSKLLTQLGRIAVAEALSMMRAFITEVVDDKHGYENLMKTYAKHRKKF
jgi:hypothetical protein